MPANIQALLKRKRLSGDEVGRVLILILIEANTGGTPSLSAGDDDMARLVRCMQTDRERAVYAAYIDLYNALVNEINTTEAYFQQAENALYRYLSYITDALTGEEIERAADRSPVVITRAQAEDFMARANEKTPAAAIAALHRKSPSDATLFSLAQRARDAGIALIDPEDAAPGRIDARGFYVEDPSLTTPRRGSLRLLFADLATQEDMRRLPADMFRPAMRYMIAYNEMLGLLAARYGLPELSRLQKDTPTLAAQAEAVNGVLAELRDTVYGGQIVQETKLSLIDTALLPLDLDGLEPSRECLAAVEERLRDDPFPLRGATMGPLLTALRMSALGAWEGGL